MAYDIQRRSDYLKYTSEQKWLFREHGQLYKQLEDENSEMARPDWPENLCKQESAKVNDQIYQYAN